MNNKIKSKSAFTLAEVLITLVIIGIVAALTIPTAINNYRKQEYVSGLKKAYSTLAQVTTQIIAEHGAQINWVTSTNDIYNLYKSKLVNVKECGSNSGCFEQTRRLLNGGILSDGWDTLTMHRKLIMSDGTQLMLGGASHDFSRTCESAGLGIFGCHNICQTFFVDVNGNKGPNQWGMDLFTLVLTRDGFLPAGYENVANCSRTGSGYDCAARVLRENAINY